MNKKILLAGLFLVWGQAMADTGPGCGWGAQVFKGKSGVPSHVMAATTNGTFGNQTFGMSTGTGGCDATKKITVAQLNQFLDSNLDKVAYDMSRGHGEVLESLASLMGIAEQDKTSFFNAAKANFDRIFSTAEVSRAQVVDALVVVMQEDGNLAKYVPAS